MSFLRLSCLINPRILIILAIACFASLVFSSQARGAEQAPFWGPNSSTQIDVLKTDYHFGEHYDEYCQPQSFVVETLHKTGWSSGIYQYHFDGQCAFETSFGEIGTGARSLMQGHGDVEAYPLDLPGLVVQVPNANSIFMRQTYLRKYSMSSIELHPSPYPFKKEYSLKDGAAPEILRGSNGSAVRVGNVKSSQNGSWLIVQRASSAGITHQFIRVKADDMSMLTFHGAVSQYSPYSGSSVNMAITNDGRYAALAGGYGANLKLFDLSTCVPNADYNLINATGCDAKNMVPYLEDKLGGQVTGVNNLKFGDDGRALYMRVGIEYPSGDRHSLLVRLSPTGTTFTTNYIALGDSFASGEGEFDYFYGTDVKENKCHLSPLSYPYVMANILDFDSVHSVACSGATTDKVIGNNGAQFTTKVKDSPLGVDWLPGYKAQIKFIKNHKPNIITISMGGNDIGFADIVKKCVAPPLIPFVMDGTCFSSYEDRMGLVENIDNHFGTWANLYSQLRSYAPPDARIYVIGYPQIVNPYGNNCTLNVQLNGTERLFASNLVSYLNFVISQAAKKAGVQYVDVENAFSGHNLCGQQYSAMPAVNGLTEGDDIGPLSFNVLGHESYHPTLYGHSLLASAIMKATNDLTESMSAPDSSVTAPDGSQAADLLHGSTKSGDIVRMLEFDDEDGQQVAVVVSGNSVSGSLQGSSYLLQPNTEYSVDIHSKPMQLGTVKTDSLGNLHYTFQIPASLPPGLHTIDIYGKDINGQPIDIQRLVYVAASTTDWDGDGVPNSEEPCGIFEASGIDSDSDGIDDACDGIIGQIKPPAGSKNTDTGPESSEPTNSQTPIKQPKKTATISYASPGNPLQGTNAYNPQSFDSKKVLGVKTKALKKNKTINVIKEPATVVSRRPIKEIAFVALAVIAAGLLTYIGIISYAKKH